MIAKWIAGIVAVSCLVIVMASPACAAGAGGNGETSRKYRILHIMSYHSPWRWTDGQLHGFKFGMGGVASEYRVFQMDTKRRSSPGEKEQAGREARKIIDSWKPDLVYVTDDDAQEYVTRHYVNKGIPFVFSGVNRSPSHYGFDRVANVTGVLETEHFAESVRLLKEIAPNVRRIAVIFDTDPMWAPIMARMRAGTRQFPDMDFVSWDRIETFAEYRKKMHALQSRVDAVALIGIFNFKDAAGRNVPYQDVLKWTAENSRLPDFSLWVDRVHYGTLCAVNVSESEQGIAAGRIARAILVEGTSPGSIRPQPTVKGVPVISIARAKKLGLRVKSGLLLSSEVVPDFQWERK
jgi:ABC-type uncharacterized transport system substrate-binding protein